MLNLHDALDFGRVERVHDCLSPGDLKLGLSVGERGGDRRRVREVSVLAKGVDDATFSVLPDVVVGEFTGCSEKRAEE